MQPGHGEDVRYARAAELRQHLFVHKRVVPRQKGERNRGFVFFHAAAQRVLQKRARLFKSGLSAAERRDPVFFRLAAESDAVHHIIHAHPPFIAKRIGLHCGGKPQNIPRLVTSLRIEVHFIGGFPREIPRKRETIQGKADAAARIGNDFSDAPRHRIVGARKRGAFVALRAQKEICPSCKITEKADRGQQERRPSPRAPPKNQHRR